MLAASSSHELLLCKLSIQSAGPSLCIRFMHAIITMLWEPRHLVVGLTNTLYTSTHTAQCLLWSLQRTVRSVQCCSSSHMASQASMCCCLLKQHSPEPPPDTSQLPYKIFHCCKPCALYNTDLLNHTFRCSLARKVSTAGSQRCACWEHEQGASVADEKLTSGEAEFLPRAWLLIDLGLS